MVRTAWAITIPGNTNTTIMPITPDNFIIIFSQCHKVKMISIQTMKSMKSMKDIKINFSVCILHALHVLHGKIKYSVLKFMTLNILWPGQFLLQKV